MVYFQQKLLEKVGVTKTQTSKTQTSDPRDLRPRKTQTPGWTCLENSCPGPPKNSHPLGVSKTQTLNSIFFKYRRYWVPLTFKYLYIRARKGGLRLLEPCHDIAYTTEMNKQVGCFQISIGSGTISQSDSG